MNKIMTLFAAAALVASVASGCDPVDCTECGMEDLRHVSVALAGDARIRPDTKVLDVKDWQEALVQSCRLYVFSEEGYQIDQWNAEDGEFDFYLTDGVYHFVAVVNKDGLPGKDATLEDLYAVTVPIEENAPEHFVMVGRLMSHVIEGDEKITIEVRRLVAKVSFVVRSAFEKELAYFPFEVKNIYMTNVAGTNDLGLTVKRPADDGPWYNKMIWDEAVAARQPYPDEMMHAAYTRKLAAGDSIMSGHVFYVYPNAGKDNHDREVWGGRCTRFVVEATLNGETTYYPVTITNDTFDGVRPNKHYHIDLTIKNWGFEHPEDEEGNYGMINATISVMDWDDGGDIVRPF